MQSCTLRRFKSLIAILLTVSFIAAIPLLAACESQEEKAIREQREKLFAPRKEKIDMNKVTDFDPYK